MGSCSQYQARKATDWESLSQLQLAAHLMGSAAAHSMLETERPLQPVIALFKE